jgi:hypothetical protein
MFDHDLFLTFSAISAIFGAVTTQADEVRLGCETAHFPGEFRHLVGSMALKKKGGL